MKLNNYIECSNCFKLVEKSNTNCPFCGENLSVEEEKPEPTEKEKTSGKKLYYVAFWIFVASLLIPGLFILFAMGNSTGFYGGLLGGAAVVSFYFLFVYVFAFSQGPVVLFLISLILTVIGRIKHKHNNSFTKLLFVEIVFIVISGILYALLIASL